MHDLLMKLTLLLLPFRKDPKTQENISTIAMELNKDILGMSSHWKE